MSDGNYVSPYGFGPVTDFVIDCVAERHDQTDFADKLDRLSEGMRESFELNVDHWWQNHMGHAVDKMEDLLSEFIELDPVTD